LIVSSATADRISAAMTIRRIYRSTLKGIKQPIDLYEVIPRAGQKFSSDHYKTFNQALIAFEANDWQKSIRLLSELQVTGAIMDPAVTFLKSRATEKATEDAVAIR
jgi:hypothetical protein